MKHDEFARLFGDCRKLPLMESLADIVRRHAAADGAPRSYMHSTSGGRTVAEMLHLGLHHELLFDARAIFDRLQEHYEATFGPRLSLVGNGRESMDDGHALAFCFDTDIDHDHQTLELGEVDWGDLGFDRAARAYQRECGWDFPPGEAGLWLTYCILTDGWGSEGRMFYTANLVGFVVLHDRDEDGDYESLAHIWTATAVRRKGIARKLVTEARRRFPVRSVEGPVTESGDSLLRSAWPEFREGNDR